MSTDSEKLYNQFSKSKKQQRYIWISSLSFLAFCFVAVLIFLSSKWNDVVVIKENGQKIEAFQATQQQTFQANAKLHLDRTFYYLNTFDRFTEKEHRGKTLLHMDARAADRVWSVYNTEGIFADVRTKGVIYKGDIVSGSIVVTGEKEPFRFQFEGIIIRNDKGRKEAYKATCTGDMIYYTPVYPQKPTGFFVTNYTQNLTPYELQ